MGFRFTRNSYRIGRLVGQQGLRSRLRNQAGIEKYATGPDSTHPVLENHHAKDNPQNGLLSKRTEHSTKGKRLKWTTEEYKDVIEAIYTASLNPTVISTTIAAYNIWRDKYPKTGLT